jgi:hypothetical protein
MTPPSATRFRAELENRSDADTSPYEWGGRRLHDQRHRQLHHRAASWCRSTATTSAPRFETAEPSLKALERATFVGLPARTPDRVAIGFHEVF